MGRLMPRHPPEARHIAIGRQGEQHAAKYLKKQGLRILQRNYRIAAGEIDIVAEDGQTLVFVEVKTSSGSAFGSPESWVTPRKRAQVARIAAAYLQEHAIDDQDCRFDVVGIQMYDAAKPVIRHLKNAFCL